MTKFDAKWVAGEEAKRAFLAENGLYADTDEHSSCGVGLVVSIDDQYISDQEADVLMN